MTKRLGPLHAPVDGNYPLRNLKAGLRHEFQVLCKPNGQNHKYGRALFGVAVKQEDVECVRCLKAFKV